MTNNKIVLNAIITLSGIAIVITCILFFYPRKSETGDISIEYYGRDLAKVAVYQKEYFLYATGENINFGTQREYSSSVKINGKSIKIKYLPMHPLVLNNNEIFASGFNTEMVMDIFDVSRENALLILKKNNFM